jgi:hypothetical protein
VIRKEIENIENGVWDKQNNPLKNAPHIQEICISSNWDKPYSREVAAYTIVIFFILKIFNIKNYIRICFIFTLP